MTFENKNILLISPKFFNYEIEILNYLETKGANVIFFDDRPSGNQLIKALIRLKICLKYVFINIYYLNIFYKISMGSITFDFFLLIKGEATPLWFIKKLKKKEKAAKFIYYTYDSVQNIKKSDTFYDFFDNKYSFEIDNFLRSRNFKNRPLFYLPEYENISNYILDIDMLFIATLHTDRYIVFNQILKNLYNYNVNVFKYFYISGKLNFFYNKIFNKYFRIVKFNDITFKPLKKHEIINLFSRTKCILDIEHPLQNGLTMRTIECIGAKKKLITTNRNILNYDFYNSNNIHIIDRLEPTIPINFFETPFIEIDQKVYYKYSLKSWIEDVFQ